ncbi:MAG: TOBE domain-containing protein, partial [Oricola sp.]|nr:TOBE domain-containing protein [Oricola sp.]
VVPTDQHENHVEGMVEELIYLGDHIRVRMKVAGNDEFIVKVRNRGQRWDLEQGQTRTIGWSAKDCKALDAVA